MALKAEASCMTIAPCYGGRVLANVKHLAGDGLSVLSIRQSHRHCRVTTDPVSKQPLLTCTQGFKARNSFWNLHKPDLSKVKGLECSTTESVTELLRSHDVQNAGKSTYRKKVFRLLGSLVGLPKRPKVSKHPMVLRENSSRPFNTCVLSSLCKETEIIDHGFVKVQEPTSTVDCQEKISKTCLSPTESMAILNKELLKTSPHLTNVTTLNDLKLHSTIHDCLQKEFSNDSSTLVIHFSEAGNVNLSSVKIAGDIQSSKINLCSKQSELHFSVPISLNQSFNNSRNANSMQNGNGCEIETTQSKDTLNYERSPNSLTTLETHPQKVVESIFSEVFKEMQELEEYISSYISSFCVLEEEFDNYPALRNSSGEVVSHFLGQIHETQRVNSFTKEDKHTIHCSDQKVLFDPKSFSNCNCLEKEEKIHILDIKQIDVSPKDSQDKAFVSADVNIETGGLCSSEYEQSTFERNSFPGYCYWEENEVHQNEGLASSEKNDIKHKMQQAGNTSVVALSFFEDLWNENFKVFLSAEDRTEQHDFYKQPIHSYGQWASTYNCAINEEAQQIVYAIESLLNGDIENEDIRYNPCTIIELEDNGYMQQFTQNDLRSLNNIANEISLNAEAQVNEKTDPESFKFFTEKSSNQTLFYDSENEKESSVQSNTNFEKDIVLEEPTLAKTPTNKQSSNASNDIVSYLQESLAQFNEESFAIRNKSSPCSLTKDKDDNNTNFLNPETNHSKFKSKPSRIGCFDCGVACDPPNAENHKSNFIQQSGLHQQGLEQISLTPNTNSKEHRTPIFSSPNVQINLQNPILNKK